MKNKSALFLDLVFIGTIIKGLVYHAISQTVGYSSQRCRNRCTFFLPKSPRTFFPTLPLFDDFFYL